ncbi:MAG: DUF3536 domain-containing protein [Chloroflexota bacterium]
MERTTAGSPFLTIHGHFYQPPREDPFTGLWPIEPGAEPYRNFNQKITAECYRPNAEAGNFARISFDLGPSLAQWLANNDPATHRNIVASDKRQRRRTGVGNAMAQAYNHTILPLASHQEKRVQVAWGVADFRRRFGRPPEGMWLPETAVDYATLGVLADFGLSFTVLAPWQADGEVDTSGPYLVRLPGGRQLTVFFYNAALSGAVSFDPQLTVDAPWFSSAVLRKHLNQEKLARGEPQFLLIATDGELYGHHQPFRDRFLTHLLTEDAPRDGFVTGSLAQYLHDNPPRREVTLRENTSWSCHHGVSRWADSGACSEGHGEWKWHLRRALGRLAAEIDALYERSAAEYLHDPWAALEGALPLLRGDVVRYEFYGRHARRWPGGAGALRLCNLLRSQYARHMMFTSCAFFLDDFDRIEPRNAVAWAARAIERAEVAMGHPAAFEWPFVQDLAALRSWRTGVNGAAIYRALRGGPRLEAALTPMAA